MAGYSCVLDKTVMVLKHGGFEAASAMQIKSHKTFITHGMHPRIQTSVQTCMHQTVPRANHAMTQAHMKHFS